MGKTPLAGQADPVVTAPAGQTAGTDQASHRAPVRALSRTNSASPRLVGAAFYFVHCVHRIAAFSPCPMNYHPFAQPNNPPLVADQTKRPALVLRLKSQQPQGSFGATGTRIIRSAESRPGRPLCRLCGFTRKSKQPCGQKICAVVRSAYNTSRRKTRQSSVSRGKSLRMPR